MKSKQDADQTRRRNRQESSLCVATNRAQAWGGHEEKVLLESASLHDAAVILGRTFYGCQFRKTWLRNQARQPSHHAHS